VLLGRRRGSLAAKKRKTRKSRTKDNVPWSPSPSSTAYPLALSGRSYSSARRALVLAVYPNLRGTHPLAVHTSPGVSCFDPVWVRILKDLLLRSASWWWVYVSRLQVGCGTVSCVPRVPRRLLLAAEYGLERLLLLPGPVRRLRRRSRQSLKQRHRLRPRQLWWRRALAAITRRKGTERGCDWMSLQLLWETRHVFAKIERCPGLASIMLRPCELLDAPLEH
jgi:hypothetical protein